jgi:hypothetical protein
VSDEPTLRELAREIARLAAAIEQQGERFERQFDAMRADVVSKEVYGADKGRVADAQHRQDRRLEELERRGRGLVTAVTGMLLSIVGGVIIAIMSRGLL